MSFNRAPKVTAVIPAAGLGLRMRPLKKRKPFINLNGKPLMAYTISALEKSRDIDEIVLAVEKRSISKARKLVHRFNFKKVKAITAGGATRAESVRNGLKRVSADTDIVLIHDVARPFIDNDILRRSIGGAEAFGACVVAVKAKSTIKKVGKGGFVETTPPRDGMWEIQTPQVFKKALILKAYERFLKRDSKFTDDSQLVEKMGKRVKVIEGSYRNIKITTPEDLVVAAALLRCG